MCGGELDEVHDRDSVSGVGVSSVGVGVSSVRCQVSGVGVSSVKCQVSSVGVSAFQMFESRIRNRPRHSAFGHLTP